MRKILSATLAASVLAAGAAQAANPFVTTTFQVSATVQPNCTTTSALNTIFGDGTATTAMDSGTGTGMANAFTYTVYGQLPDSATNQASTPGTYTDTITVTVTY